MIAVLGGLPDVERDLIRTRTTEGRTRTTEGRSRAQKRGQRMGRKPKLTEAQGSGPHFGILFPPAKLGAKLGALLRGAAARGRGAPAGAATPLYGCFKPKRAYDGLLRPLRCISSGAERGDEDAERSRSAARNCSWWAFLKWLRKVPPAA
jgi:hypothetical protein